VINGTLIVMLALLAGLALLAHWRGGGELVTTGLGDGFALLLRFGPVIVVSFLAAGFAETLIPGEWIRSALGEESGVKGIVIASGAGMLTPSGPFVSMPIAAVMIRSGVGAGPVVAFLTGWSLLALHRFVAWEVPVLGFRIAALRYGICLVVPVLAGLVARSLGRT
jgi:uncharacterized membrane protein YraQ (UPF0718 family)